MNTKLKTTTTTTTTNYKKQLTKTTTEQNLYYLWSAHRNRLQLDSTLLEDLYLGKSKLSDEETAKNWNDSINNRLNILNPTTTTTTTTTTKLGDGGKYQKELDHAISLVQRASFVSRSIQREIQITNTTNSANNNKNKIDNSPVTVADFTVQAIIISMLHRAYPSDRFIFVVVFVVVVVFF